MDYKTKDQVYEDVLDIISILEKLELKRMIDDFDEVAKQENIEVDLSMITYTLDEEINDLDLIENIESLRNEIDCIYNSMNISDNRYECISYFKQKLDDIGEVCLDLDNVRYILTHLKGILIYDEQRRKRNYRNKEHNRKIKSNEIHSKRRERNILVASLLLQGVKKKQIAKEVECCIMTVRRDIDLFNEYIYDNIPINPNGEDILLALTNYGVKEEIARKFLKQQGVL